jgi:putative SOS response-associated peptidase YedK
MEAIAGAKQKQPFAIARQNDKPMALAGVWEGMWCAASPSSRRRRQRTAAPGA